MKIVVIGESCTDRFIYGKVNRLSPEAPIPIFNPLNTVINGGMSANVVSNLKSLQSKANIVHLAPPNNITKTRYVEEKSNYMFIRIDEGEDNIEPFKWSLFIDQILGQADMVIVSDYDKGYLSNLDLEAIAKKSSLSFLDSKRKLNSNIVDKFTWIKFNESEADNNPDLDYSKIIITLGSKGAKIDGVMFESPLPQETIDVSGAGDTFIAAFALNYFKTKDNNLAVKYANIMASKVVSKKGVAIP